MKSHKSNVHDIDVTWYPCDVEGCEDKFKSNSDLKRHKSNVHDIGDHNCNICLRNRNSSIKHENMNICRDCYKRMTGKSSRIEHIWSDYIDKHIGTDYLLSNDKSLKHNGGCSLRRPDKMYTGIELVEIDECDENQHLYANGDYTCDENRISEIYDEIDGKKLVVIRWNPDNYKVPDGYTKKNRKERLELMVKFKKHVRKNPPSDIIHIYYMFYDQNNPRISKNYPSTLIYGELR